jgi:DNA segregation ATPase FtsK/SpoIIIE-like protein
MQQYKPGDEIVFIRKCEGVQEGDKGTVMAAVQGEIKGLVFMTYSIQLHSGQKKQIVETNNTKFLQEVNNDKGKLYTAAQKLLKEQGEISTSQLQRALSIGYSKAADIIDALEAENHITKADGNGKRKAINAG